MSATAFPAQNRSLAQVGTCQFDGCDRPVRETTPGTSARYCSLEHAYQGRLLQLKRQREANTRLNSAKQSARAKRSAIVRAENLRLRRAAEETYREHRQAPLRRTFCLHLDPTVVLRPPADAIPPRRYPDGSLTAFQDDLWAVHDHGSRGAPQSDAGWARVSTLAFAAAES